MNRCIKALVQGESGSGKSTFAATFPNPSWVVMFDPWGKHFPYVEGFDEVQEEENYIALSNKGELQRIIEFFVDQDSTNPSAYLNFQAALAEKYREIENWAGGTFIFDSLTMAEYSARKLGEHKMIRRGKSGELDGRQPYAFSKERLEEVFLGGVTSLRGINVVLLTHIDEDKDEADGRMVYNPSAPGKLRKLLPSTWGEFYRAHIVYNNTTRSVAYALQTQPSDRYNACTRIGAPNPCAPRYSALFGEEEEESKPVKKGK